VSLNGVFDRGVNQGLISTAAPQSAFVFPELSMPGQVPLDDIFVFQYWPDTLEDSYSPEYSSKQIPGGTHPLYQWVGGTERSFTFTANFTAEIDKGAVRFNQGTNPSGPIDILPSARYTVDIRAALNRLRSYMLPSYGGQGGDLNALTKPPKRLYLVLENTGLGGNKDEVLVILRSAPITYESWFPSGAPRVVQVALTFSEIVQRKAQEGSAIRFLDRSPFEDDGKYYKYRGTVDRVISSG
jgi:hypothetical protein